MQGLDATKNTKWFASKNRCFYIELSTKTKFIPFKIHDELTKNTGFHRTTKKDFHARIICKEPRIPDILNSFIFVDEREFFFGAKPIFFLAQNLHYDKISITSTQI